MTRQRFFLGARLTVGLALCLVLIWLVQPSRFLELIPQLRGDWLLISVLGYALAVILNVAAVQHLLRSLSHTIGLSTLAGIHLQGVFFNYFLPTNFGGDIYKVMAIGGQINSTSSATVGVILQRSISLVVALGMISVGVAAFSPVSVEVAGSTAIISVSVAVLLVLAAFVRIPKSLALRARGHRWGKRLLERWGALFMAVHALRRPSVVATTVSLLFVSQSLTVCGAFAMARCLDIDIGWQNFVYIVPLSYLAGAAPISINGLGVREGAVVLLLTQLGIDRTTAAAFALALLAINVTFALVGGLLFALNRRHITPKQTH